MFELFLGIRYLKAKRKQRFISVITIISVMGVMVGVMALIVVLSVMNGFRSDLMGKILGVNSHVLVLNLSGTFGGYEEVAEKVEKMDGVVAITPMTDIMVITEINRCFRLAFRYLIPRNNSNIRRRINPLAASGERGSRP